MLFLLLFIISCLSNNALVKICLARVNPFHRVNNKGINTKYNPRVMAILISPRKLNLWISTHKLLIVIYNTVVN